MPKYKGPHRHCNFKNAAAYGVAQGFGPFRQRFTPLPKDVKTALRAGNTFTPQETEKEATHEPTDK